MIGVTEVNLFVDRPDLKDPELKVLGVVKRDISINQEDGVVKEDKNISMFRDYLMGMSKREVCIKYGYSFKSGTFEHRIHRAKCLLGIVAAHLDDEIAKDSRFDDYKLREFFKHRDFWIGLMDRVGLIEDEDAVISRLSSDIDKLIEDSRKSASGADFFKLKAMLRKKADELPYELG